VVQGVESNVFVGVRFVVWLVGGLVGVVVVDVVVDAGKRSGT